MVRGGPHLFNGEACCLDDIGRADFEKLNSRVRRRRWFAGCNRVTYCAFDLLVQDGVNIMRLPLIERKAMLAKLLAGAPVILVVTDLPAEASLFAEAVEPMRLEGFVGEALGQQVPAGRGVARLGEGSSGWGGGRSAGRLRATSSERARDSYKVPLIAFSRCSSRGLRLSFARLLNQSGVSRCAPVQPRPFPVAGLGSHSHRLAM